MHSSWSHPAVLQVCTSYENVNSSVLFALFFVLLALLRAMCLDLWLSIVSFCVFIAVAVLVSSFFSISHTVYVPPFHLLYSCTYFALRLWFSDASTWIFLSGTPPLPPFLHFFFTSFCRHSPSVHHIMLNWDEWTFLRNNTITSMGGFHYACVCMSVFLWLCVCVRLCLCDAQRLCACRRTDSSLGKTRMQPFVLALVSDYSLFY